MKFKRMMVERCAVLCAALIAACMSSASVAGADAFTKGPVLTEFGENALIPDALQNANEQVFKVAFDVADASPGNVNRSFNSVARFINMHVRAGVPLEQIEVAVVVHGQASAELLNATAYAQRFNHSNASQPLLQQLLELGVRIQLCGQSAAMADIPAAELLPGISMELSAMTAHALLQQQGYTLNPF